jgi:competence protein ComEC
VQTQNHTLVFDAGPRLSASFDMGDSVVVPFLHAINTKKVDMLVVSHGDNDHIGGANAILSQLSVLSIKTSVPKLLPHADLCLQGEAWNWDGVKFQFLYPGRDDLDLDNDSSCVLRVSTGSHHILLTGDIEKYAEKELLAHSKNNLVADIIIAPHHGSKTSALKTFVSAVNPQYVLFSTGFRNRYHFPHPSVLREYQKIGATTFNTPNTGAIQFSMNEKGISPVPDLYRKKHKYYWNN